MNTQLGIFFFWRLYLASFGLRWPEREALDNFSARALSRCSLVPSLYFARAGSLHRRGVRKGSPDGSSAESPASDSPVGKFDSTNQNSSIRKAVGGGGGDDDTEAESRDKGTSTPEIFRSVYSLEKIVLLFIYPCYVLERK